MVDLPSYVWLLLLTGVIGTRVTTCVNLYRGAVAATGDSAQAWLVAGVAGGALGGWIVIDALLAWAGVYQQGPWFLVAVVGGFVAILLAAKVPQVARALADPSMAPGLVEPESFRAVGAVFLVVLALGKLPALFAWLAGFGDVAVGLAAPFIAKRLRHRPGGRALIIYNVFGILDFVVALIAGNLIGVGLLPAAPAPMDAINVLPLVLIPTAATPLAAALHVLSLSTRRVHRRVTLEHRPLPEHENPAVDRSILR
jgi:hypothetical protein